jgi:hypothetical protein
LKEACVPNDEALKNVKLRLITDNDPARIAVRQQG